MTSLHFLLLTMVSSPGDCSMHGSSRSTPGLQSIESKVASNNRWLLVPLTPADHISITHGLLYGLQDGWISKMAYRHPNPPQAAAMPSGWQQQFSQQLPPDGGMWTTQFSAPGTQNLASFGFVNRNNMMGLDNRQSQHYPLHRPMSHPGPGLMGPPPVPQKVPPSVGHQFHPQMMQRSQSMHPDMLRNKPHVGGEQAGLSHRPTHNPNFNAPLTFRKLPQQNQQELQGAASAMRDGSIANWHNSSTIPGHTVQQPHANATVSADHVAAFPVSKNNAPVAADVLDDSSVDELVMEELLNSRSISPSPPAFGNSQWQAESKALQLPTSPINKQHQQVDKPAAMLNPHPSAPPRPPSVHNDLRHLQQNPPFQPGVAPSPAAAIVNQPMGMPPGSPASEPMLPHMSNNPPFICPSAAGQKLSLPSAASISDKDKPKRRRRKRCGDCEPCQLKEDCGACYVCRNKGQVNAICKARKCLILRKKVSDVSLPPYYSSLNSTDSLKASVSEIGLSIYFGVCVCIQLV